MKVITDGCVREYRRNKGFRISITLKNSPEGLFLFSAYPWFFAAPTDAADCLDVDTKTGIASQ